MNPPSEIVNEAAGRLQGRLRKYHSNYYYVDVADAAGETALYECHLRGLLKKEGSGVLVGDVVELEIADAVACTGWILRVVERRNEISRPKIANVDQAVIVYSLREPAFDPQQLDRYLTHVELAGIEPVICISKTDLAAHDDELAEIRQLYAERLDYTVILTSVHRFDSLAEVRALTQGRTTVLAGPSGAGKSSLLNVLNPDFQLRVGEISEKAARGQHTTRHVELLALAPDTYIADTPGFSNLKFNTVLPGGIEAAMRDFAPYRDQCAFSDCLHVDEANCAVLANLSAIAESRYAAYLAMLAEARQYKEQMQNTSAKQEFGYKTLNRKGQEDLQILRLKGKARDTSRRTRKQEVHTLLAEESDGEAEDSLVEESGDSL